MLFRLERITKISGKVAVFQLCLRVFCFTQMENSSRDTDQTDLMQRLTLLKLNSAKLAMRCMDFRKKSPFSLLSISSLMLMADETQHLKSPFFYSKRCHVIITLVFLLLSIAANTLLYYGAPLLFPLTFHTSKHRSWILTTCSSIVMTSGSLPFLAEYLTYKSDLSIFPMLNSAYAVIFCAYFMAYLLMDLVFGWLYYRKYMDLITGYTHHTICTFSDP